MLISGLVVVFGATEAHAAERARTLDLLAARSDLTIGDVADAGASEPAHSTGLLRVPAVLECSTPRASRASIEWIESLPGVTAVEVIHIGYGDQDSGTKMSTSEGARRR